MTRKFLCQFKSNLFLEALDHVDPLLEKGYGFTVSDITVYIGTLKKGDHILQNRDVKQMLMTTMVIKYSTVCAESSPQCF